MIRKFFRKYVLFLLLSLLCRFLSSANAAQDGLPALDRGTSYKSARVKLLKMGYTPSLNFKEKDCPFDDDRCRAYPEVLYCSGDASFACLFEWKDKNGKILQITTFGSEVKNFKVDVLYQPNKVKNK